MIFFYLFRNKLGLQFLSTLKLNDLCKSSFFFFSFMALSLFLKISL